MPTKLFDPQLWEVIPEFPEYEVSNFGLIFSNRQRRVIATTRNNHGHVRVALSNHYGRFTRSVSMLVAEAFVERPDALCNAVVILDGNKLNVAAENLAWRPRGFAWEYAHQLKVRLPRHYLNLSVQNEQTGVEYKCILDAAVAEGLLCKEIWRSVNRGTACYPVGCSFVVTQRV